MTAPCPKCRLVVEGTPISNEVFSGYLFTCPRPDDPKAAAEYDRIHGTNPMSVSGLGWTQRGAQEQ